MKINHWMIAGMVFALLVIVSNVQADALVYEGFETGSGKDYTADATIVGTNPAVTGFKTTDAWAETGGLATDVVDYVTRAAGMSYSNLITTAGTLEHYRASASKSLKTLDRDFDYTYTSDVAWWSVLFSFSSLSDSGPASVFKMILEDPNRANKLDTTLVATGVAGGVKVELDLTGGSANDIDFGILSANTTHLLVLKAVAKDGHYDDYEVWIDPANLTTLGTADYTGQCVFRELTLVGTSAPFGRLYTRGFIEAGEWFKLDELRLGVSQGDVLPIPEPATLTLLGLGGLGLLIRRRRS